MSGGSNAGQRGGGGASGVHRSSSLSKQFATSMNINNNNGQSSSSSFNRRPPSDTPLMSYASSPQNLSSSANGSSTSLSALALDEGGGQYSSGKNSPKSGTPPQSMPGSRRPGGVSTLDVPGLTRSKVSPDGTIAKRDVESKLVIVMVGLPARGKSYVTKKLCRYLNWQQHDAKIFNVGNTRRNADRTVGPASRPLPDDPDNKKEAKKAAESAQTEAQAQAQRLAEELHNSVNDAPHDSADFFSPDNTETSNLREKWAMDTLEQLLDYVLEGSGSVGILDATNSTVARRKKVLKRIKERSEGRLKVLFLESICTNKDIIEQNVRLKLSGPDYKDMDPDKAINDFLARLHNYEKAYEPIGDEEEKDDDFQYIKMIDVGRKVVCYNIQGFLAGQAVFFLLNFNLAERQIWITRHGESEDNATGRIGGDAHLTPRGRKFGRALARFMDYQKSEFRQHQLEKYVQNQHFLQTEAEKHGSSGTSTPVSEPVEPNFCVWTSMLRRTIETAEYLDEDMFAIKEMRMLNELGAGICDGMTYSEISQKYPQEYAARIADKIRYRYPGIGGESYLDVINRLRPVIVEMERMEDNALIIAHRVVARVLLAYFMNLGRDAIGDLDVPLHTLYVLEPKPYGVDWAVFEYDEESDWFYKVPRETIQKQIEQLQRENTRERSNSKPPTVGSGHALGAAKDRTFSVIPTDTEVFGGPSASSSMPRRRPSAVSEHPVFENPNE
jgi:6-phosphofructo-2-kinase